MQPKNTKIALIIGALFLGASGASLAATEAFNVTIVTIGDVDVQENASVDLGSSVSTSAGGTCVITPSTAATVSDVRMQILRGTPVADDSNDFGIITTTGAGCIADAVNTPTGTPGEYLFSGSAGTPVTITLTAGSEAAGDFTFTPSALVSTYDGSTAGDSATLVAPGTPFTTAFANVTENADANVTSGEMVMVVGGELSIINDLASQTTFNAVTYNLNVVY